MSSQISYNITATARQVREICHLPEVNSPASDGVQISNQSKVMSVEFLTQRVPSGHHCSRRALDLSSQTHRAYSGQPRG